MRRDARFAVDVSALRPVLSSTPGTVTVDWPAGSRRSDPWYSGTGTRQICGDWKRSLSAGNRETSFVHQEVFAVCCSGWKVVARIKAGRRRKLTSDNQSPVECNGLRLYCCTARKIPRSASTYLCTRHLIYCITYTYNTSPLWHDSGKLLAIEGNGPF